MRSMVAYKYITQDLYECRYGKVNVYVLCLRVPEDESSWKSFQSEFLASPASDNCQTNGFLSRPTRAMRSGPNWRDKGTKITMENLIPDFVSKKEKDKKYVFGVRDKSNFN